MKSSSGESIASVSRYVQSMPAERSSPQAASERAPVMIPSAAHLDPRFKQFPNLPEEEYESILAVPILARGVLAGALNVRTLAPREYGRDEVELLQSIADQVAQSIVHAQLYSQAQRRV